MPFIGNAPARVPLTSADITDGIIGIADLSATGTKDSTTFLRGDNTFATAGAAAGQIIQVVTATDSTQRTVTTSSYATASNTLSVTITPASTSNKIFIILTTRALAVNGVAWFTLFKNSSNLITSGGANAIIPIPAGGGEGIADHICMTYLDSPSSTSALTYQIYMKNNGSGGEEARINTGYGTDNTIGRITAFEIKG
jgi:hypothetical protein